jgi:Ribbon-helix-helix protein, copG family
MAKKRQHGGSREGAGRKPKYEAGATEPLTARVPPDLLEALGQIAQEEGWSRSQAVTEAIRAFVKRKKR